MKDDRKWLIYWLLTSTILVNAMVGSRCCIEISRFCIILRRMYNSSVVHNIFLTPSHSHLIIKAGKWRKTEETDQLQWPKREKYRENKLVLLFDSPFWRDEEGGEEGKEEELHQRKIGTEPLPLLLNHLCVCEVIKRRSKNPRMHVSYKAEVRRSECQKHHSSSGQENELFF